MLYYTHSKRRSCTLEQRLNLEIQISCSFLKGNLRDIASNSSHACFQTINKVMSCQQGSEAL